MLNRYPSINCTGCESCVNACPINCIVFEQNDEGFFYPHIDGEKCIHCGKCERACPSLVKKEECKEQNTPEAYAVINNDLEQRKSSSSGGVFVLLAKRILERQGLVFGAAFSDDCKSVEHIAVTDEKELHRLQGSKYVQSRIGKAYSEAEQHLKMGREVLFTGTPCQISGLLAYLGKEYDNLFTQDFVCHGVPSPGIWSRYLEEKEQSNGSEISCVAFRNKSLGWVFGQMKIDFQNGKSTSVCYHDDLYVRGFLADLFLRPSCYQCENKGLDRCADITLGDFWGVKQVAPSMNDFYGTSLVFAHNEKGKELLTLLDSIKMQPVDAEAATRYNPAAIRSVKRPPQRELFFSSVKTASLTKVLGRMCRRTPKEKVKTMLRNVKHRLKALKYRR